MPTSHPKNDPVHAIWVGSRLSLLEQLTVRLFQSYGHEFHLWLYEDCDGVPTGTVVRNAADVLPRSSLFHYAGKPATGLTNGGVGSLGHWSDQFQLKVLYEHGGYYTQLDVTPLAPLPTQDDHVFVGAPGAFQTCFMRCPKGSPWARDAYDTLRRLINPDTMPELSWPDSMDCVERSVHDHKLAGNIIRPPEFTNGFSFRRITAPRRSRLIHWWNSAAAETKNQPIPGSFYSQLLATTGLIADSGVQWTIRRLRSVLGEWKLDYIHHRHA